MCDLAYVSYTSVVVGQMCCRQEYFVVDVSEFDLVGSTSIDIMCKEAFRLLDPVISQQFQGLKGLEGLEIWPTAITVRSIETEVTSLTKRIYRPV